MIDDKDLLHTKARADHPMYPKRFPVPDELVPWSEAFVEYAPVQHVAQTVLDNSCETNPNGWAEGPVPRREQIEKRGSHELQARQQQWQYDESGRPLNPRGRTGICGRGKLGKWGPNHAGDAVVTRHVTRQTAHGPRKCLEMVAIKRKDTGEWAIPGGMQDPGEVGVTTLVREFKEEAGAVSPEEKSRFDTMVDELFRQANGRVIYRGYVDDPRNTDNAWMETIAMHFHCSDKMGEMLQLRAGDDAADVMWLEVGDHNEAYKGLYASHKQIVDLVYLTHGPTTVGAPTQPSRFSADLRAIALDAIEDDEEAEFRSLGAESGQCAAMCRGLKWSIAAVSATGLSYVDGGLSSADLLDLNSIAAQDMRVAALAVAQLIAARDDGCGDDVNKCTMRVAGKLCMGDMVVAGNVFENLTAIFPWADLLPRLRMVSALVRDHEGTWTFPDDGSPEAPRLPPTSSAASFSLDTRAASAFRHLCFVDKPPALSRAASVISLRARLLDHTGCALQPTAVVTIGAPGSGKTQAVQWAVAHVEAALGGPPSEAYAKINPDDWISEICDNNNAYRNVANYCNQETFLQAVSQRRHIVFDGTGKSLLNTCGRVIGRLQPAGYRVILVVVLASEASCWRRIERRRQETDRGVPASILSSTITDLQRAVPVYLTGASRGLCEVTLLYDNDADGMLYEMPPTAVVGAASTPDESEAALARARELLGS